MGVQQSNPAHGSRLEPARHQPGAIRGLLGIAALVAGCKGEAAVQEQAVRPVKVAVVARPPKGAR